MENRRATVNDVPKIFDNLAARLADEYYTSRQFQSDPNISRDGAIRSAKKMFRDAIRRREADTLLVDAQPIALIGWLIQNGEVHTAFASGEDFFSARFVRPMARYVRHLQQRLDGAPLVASNWSGRNDIDRWFGLLGYKFFGNHGPAKIYVLWPPAK